MRSTVARELSFVVHHTIHHCALMALLVEWQGGRVPHGFGVAPVDRGRPGQRVMIGLLAGLVAGTFVSEDLTCVLAGVLVLQGQLAAAPAIAACAAGIWLGDLGLWAAGRLLGHRALQWPRIRGLVTPDREARFAEWFAANAAPAMIGSRFLPGTRLPLYVAAGALGGSFRLFAFWSIGRRGVVDAAARSVVSRIRRAAAGEPSRASPPGRGSSGLPRLSCCSSSGERPCRW